MREIKFRGRRAELPAGFVYGYFVILSGMNYIIDDDGHHLIVAGTKQQYTGLKDKNGKEIYEGDIVRHKSREVIKGEVFLYEGAFVVGKAVVDHALIHFNVPNFVEIIGNIYENPELLNGG